MGTPSTTLSIHHTHSTGGRMRLGIAVGSACLDLALMHGDTVLASSKCPTTGLLTSDLRTSLDSLPHLREYPVDSITVSAGWLTDAVRAGLGLAPIAALRLTQSGGHALGPFTGWPAALRAAVDCGSAVLTGGHDLAMRQLAPLDNDAIARFATTAAARGARGIAITASSSPAAPEHELVAAGIISSQVPGLPITLSHEIAGLGLLERENTALLNAALRPLAERSIDELRDVLNDYGLTAPLMFARHDATLCNAERLRRFPVTALESGAAVALRGAAVLAGTNRAMVMEIGARSSRIGFVENGRPLLTRHSEGMQVPGLRVALQLPRTLSTPIGGARTIDCRTGELLDAHNPPVSIGGGPSETVFDAAVFLGLATAPNRVQMSALAARKAVRTATEQLRRLAAGVAGDRTPIVVVGPAADLGPAITGLDVTLPDHASCAPAIGAAMAEPAAEVERVVVTGNRTDLDRSLTLATEQAMAGVISAGADPAGVEVTESSATHISYLPGSVFRLRVRATGRIEQSGGRR
ncbi:hypothetical protein D5S17_33400 [Pseudonocardiaceae bacterium YIM PH 21723]|nr:hypothetical protein D5S17_33400 [Pseudonocardiaceae bacterium YIM PH 21723]